MSGSPDLPVENGTGPRSDSFWLPDAVVTQARTSGAERAPSRVVDVHAATTQHQTTATVTAARPSPLRAAPRPPSRTFIVTTLPEETE